MEKLNDKLRVFEAFAGYGSQSMSLRDIGKKHDVVGISEIEPDAIIAYGAVRFNIEDLHTDKTHDEMRKELMDKNVGWDFQKQKSRIPRMKKDKLEMLYKFDQATNNFGDISIIKPDDLPDFDYFTYSFPCQDISVAGEMKGIEKGQTRSGLLYECEKIIENKRPKYLLMENVKNLVSKKFRPQFDEWCKYLEGLGYTNYHNNYKCLNAKDFGLAQNRDRIFMISVLEENSTYEFPVGYKLNKVLKDFLEETVDDKYYLSEEIQKRFKQTKKDDGINNIIGTTAPEFRTIGQRDLVYSQKGIMGALVATDYKQPKQIIEIPQTTKKGYIELEVPGIADLTYPNSKTRRGRVQEDGKIYPTLMANTQDICYFEECYDRDFRIRKLTPRECLRLQGVSDRDIDKMISIELSDSSLYKLAGNSIPKNVLDALHINMFKSKDIRRLTKEESLRLFGI